MAIGVIHMNLMCSINIFLYHLSPGQGLSASFYKRPDNKYFRLVGHSAIVSAEEPRTICARLTVVCSPGIYKNTLQAGIGPRAIVCQSLV